MWSGRVVLLCGLLFGVVGVFAAQRKSSVVHNSRYGDIVISHANPVKGDGLLIAIDGMSEDLASSSNQFSASSSMLETEIAPLVSHVVGASPMAAVVPKQVEAFASSTVLRKPRANLMVVVPDLGHLTAQEFSLSNIQSLREVHPSFSVAATFEPRNTLSQLVTISTGQLPSSHGIMASQWRDEAKELVSAFDASVEGTNANVPTVADIVSLTFADPLIVSLSGDNQLAAAAAAHPSTLKRSAVLFVDSETRTLQNHGTFALLASQSIDEAVISQLFDTANPQSILGKFVRDGGVAQVSGTTLTVQPFANANAADSVAFNLANPAVYKFFSELALVQHTLSVLKTESFHSLVHDNSPDLYTFTLNGLGELLKEFGASSTESRVAARLFDVATAQILNSFGTLYHNAYSAQVVLMGSRSEVEVNLKKSVSDAIQGKAALSLESTFPHVYVEEEVSQLGLEDLCSQVNAAVSKHGYEASCMTRFTKSQSLLQMKSTKSDDEDPTLSDVAMFQLLLWLGILLVVLVWAAIYPLLYMDVTSGTFSSFLYAKKYV